jgi:hypothetical protein
MKIAKKAKKVLARLAVQKRRVDSLENLLLAGIESGDLEPYDCPVVHRFTEGIYCRETFLKAGTVVTGAVHKISNHFVLVRGTMRVAYGNTYRDIVAPALFKNEPGQKNAVCAIDDCLMYQFTPNPGNSEDLSIVYGFVTDTPDEVQGQCNNKQLLAQKKRIENAA